MRFTDVDAAIASGIGNPESDSYDPLFHIRKNLDAVLFTFSEYRQPDQWMVIDEQIAYFMGRFRWKQVYYEKSSSAFSITYWSEI